VLIHRYEMVEEILRVHSVILSLIYAYVIVRNKNLNSTFG